MERIKQLIAGLLVVFFMTSNLSGFVSAEEFSTGEQIANETLVQTDDANEIPEDIPFTESGKKIKVMWWNNLTELVPLCDFVELSVGSN